MKKYLILLGLFTSLSANAALLKSYDFDGGLTDTLSNGNTLIASGGSVVGGRYDFTNNQGLKLTSALADTSDYGIEIKMQINDSLGGFNKVIDFQDLTSDNGLYFLAGKLNFYALSGSVGSSLTLNTDFTVGLARSGGMLELFLNGTSLWSGADSTGYGISASNILNFFEDDNATNQNESFAGSVDFIRIHDDASTFGSMITPPNAVPVPAALIMFAPALLGFLGFRRKTQA